MKPLLIIKTGNAVQGLLARRGDFEKWIAEALMQDVLPVATCTVYAGEVLPDVNDISAAVVTGSAAMVTDQEPWSENTAHYLKTMVQHDKPILGICYGHQLLAHALGGMVTYHPEGREIGTVNVSLTTEAVSDRLMSSLPRNFPAHVSHAQTVSVLPEGAVILAENGFEPHQAVRFSENAWGVQFHPEFDEEIMRGYITARAEALQDEGFNVDQLLMNIVSAQDAITVLQRFADIVCGDLCQR